MGVHQETVDVAVEQYNKQEDIFLNGVEVVANNVEVRIQQDNLEEEALNNMVGEGEEGGNEEELVAL